MRKRLDAIGAYWKTLLAEVHAVISNALRAGSETEDRATRIEKVVGNKSLAIVGVSRSRLKFGCRAFRELKTRGYAVYAVSRSGESIRGETAYASLAELPERPKAVVLITPPGQTEVVLQQCTALGINRVWIQQGAESEAAIQYCIQNDISFVAHECILMHAPPVRSYHLLHRRIWQLLGRVRGSRST